MNIVQLPDLKSPRGDLAFVIGVVLNQTIRSEIAWAGPDTLASRLGFLDADRLARMDPSVLAEILRRRPSVHPFAERMAVNIVGSCDIIVAEYGGQAANLWRQTNSEKDLFGRLVSLPGIGAHKAKVAILLLDIEYGVRFRDSSSTRIDIFSLCPRLAEVLGSA